MLGLLLHAPRSPFYSPKAARSRWRHSWKAILAFCRMAHRTVRCTTGHPLFIVRCGSPSQNGTANRCRIVAVGAPDTVWCPHPTVGSATRHARIAWPTIGSADRWLTRQSGAPPDSPVNFSRTPPMNSRERPVDQSQPGAPNTVRCTPDSPVPPSDRWLGHASHVDSSADRWSS